LLFNETRDLPIGRRLPQRQKCERERDAGDDADGGDDEDERDAFLARSDTTASRPTISSPAAADAPTDQARRNARRDHRARTLARMARSSLALSPMNDSTSRPGS
jgi:hypothetical protein